MHGLVRLPNELCKLSSDAKLRGNDGLIISSSKHCSVTVSLSIRVVKQTQFILVSVFIE